MWARALEIGQKLSSMRPRLGPRDFELHAFEPVPDSRKQLQETLARQVESGRVRVNGIALSNESKTLPIYVPHSRAATSTLHPDSSVNYQQVLDVQASTLDRYCLENSIDRIDLVKIDTEGNDLRVIQGATQLLRQRPDRCHAIRVQLSMDSWREATLKDVFDLVRGTPYWMPSLFGESRNLR